MKTSIPTMKLIVIGDSSTGKTSLIERFFTDRPESNYKDKKTYSTIGPEFHNKVVKVKKEDGRDELSDLKLQVWDTAGQERFNALTSNVYRGSKGALILYDVNNRESFVRVERYWLPELQRHTLPQQGTLLDKPSSNDSKTASIPLLTLVKNSLFSFSSTSEASPPPSPFYYPPPPDSSTFSSYCVTLLVGNKCDMPSGCRQVEASEGEALARQYGMGFIEISAKLGLNVNRTFLSLVKAIIENDKLVDKSREGFKRSTSVESLNNSNINTDNNKKQGINSNSKIDGPKERDKCGEKRPDDIKLNNPITTRQSVNLSEYDNVMDKKKRKSKDNSQKTRCHC